MLIVLLQEKMHPVRTHLSSQKDFVGNKIPTYNFTFRCLASGDPDLKRPNLSSISKHKGS